MAYSAGVWEPNQQNLILFVLVDSGGNEVSGIGTAFTLEISKAGGAFAAGTGTKGEIGDGWYSYLATAGEADTLGPVAVKVTHASVVQQNLEYVVQQRNSEAIEFTYTLTESTSGNPIDGANVWFAIDSDGDNVVWEGVTDAFGIVRDSFGNLPSLDPGTYYVFRNKPGYVFDNPDTEVVS